MPLRSAGGGGFANPATTTLAMGSQNITSSGGNGIWTVTPSEGGSGIANALSAAGAAGGGTVQLMAGTYTVSTDIVWPTDGNNIVLQGIGDSTIISTTIPGSGGLPTYVFDVTGTLVAAKNLSNPARGAMTVTTSTHSDATNFTAGMTVFITGNDPDGYSWQELNLVATSGNGTSGDIVLSTGLKRAYTSATISGISQGFNNVVRNLKVVHPSGLAHAIRTNNQVNFLLENCLFDGSTASSNYALDIKAYDSTYRNNRIINYNLAETGTIGLGVVLAGIGVRFEDNLVYNSGLTSKATKAGIGANALFDSHISRNKIMGNAGHGIRLDSGTSHRGLVIADNIIAGNEVCGISVQSDTNTDILINANNIYNNGSNGIDLTSGPLFITVSGNTLEYNTDEGIKCFQADRCTLSGNYIRKNTDGIFLTGSTNIVVSGNISTNHGSGSGLVTVSNTEGTITGNKFDTNKYGINISGNESDDIISGNSCRNCTTNAILIANTAANITSIGNNYRSGTISLGTSATVYSISDMA